MRVLIIEPDKMLAKMYVQQLLVAGFEVAGAYDGHTAVELIDAQKPDVILLEPQLAGHSGIEFLHEFRSYEDWANIPVIIHSSVPKESFGGDQVAWERLGVVRYFYKPKTTAKQIIGAIKVLEPEA